MPDINVQDEKGNTHVFPDGSTPEMIAKAMGVKAPTGDPLMQQTQAAAPKTSTKPFFEKPPVGTPFPSANPIEKAGQQHERVEQLQQRALRSPTPFTTAATAIYPAAELGGALAETGVKGVAKSIGRGAVKAAATSSVGAGIGATVGGKRGAEIGAGVGLAASPFVPDKALADVPIARRLMFSDTELADMTAAQKATQQAADIKAGVRKPLPPPPDPEYVRQKTLTEAQEAAQSENVKRTAAAARSREAAFNKEGDEQMAIQKRYDDAQQARMDAEKAAKNAKFKADQEHAKELAALEKSRQAEITAQAKVRQIQDAMDAAEKAKEADAVASLKKQMAQAEKEASDAAAQKERLYTQHGDALMRRGREQAALDKAAADASKEEDVARAEVSKRPARTGSVSRPTETEKTLTRLFKKRIWTPTDEVDARNALGPDAYRRKGEGNAAYQARVMGMIRSSRAATGMTDIESGPTISSKP
jgi:hypothetical protein